MIFDEKDLISRLKHIETSLQDNNNDTTQLRTLVNELKAVVQEVDKIMAVQSEKQTHLFYRLEKLEKEIESLEKSGTKTNDRQRDLVEKALMVFLGGLVTYILTLGGK